MNTQIEVKSEDSLKKGEKEDKMQASEEEEEGIASKSELLEEKKSETKSIEETEGDKDQREKPSLPMSQSMWMKVQEKGLTPIQLVFRDVTFTVKTKKKVGRLPWQTQTSQRTLLDHVTGFANPGEVLAIMGSSGAGKTTLLNALAGRIDIKGDVLLNGNARAAVKAFAKQHQAYIMQDDVMLKHQTPREILIFSAMLRVHDLTKQEKLQRVDDIIAELGLKNCQDTKVGAAGVLRGISGGERKRVSIAMEMVTNPSLLFVDEPTSGLDSFTAIHVVDSLKHLAMNGRTVLCTIHQPNSQIFNKFDRLILLAKGKIAYFGPAKEAIKYFTSIGHPCAKYINPPDHFSKKFQLFIFFLF